MKTLSIKDKKFASSKLYPRLDRTQPSNAPSIQSGYYTAHDLWHFLTLRVRNTLRIRKILEQSW